MESIECIQLNRDKQWQIEIFTSGEALIEAVKELDVIGMLVQMETIQKRGYTTGNDILDILTNHHVGRLGENVRVQVTGYLNE